ncbi:serine hydrolase domain-containing protein [Tahibacter amnicola]|uniref:Beta-lactamase family protein n=1 Tax=Tahibacter amnicola TaxID=2976241 RepID=A0ABY6BR34_9GAMM|nr:serine hydrolase domain-containing protein [Tahibacter amnicola]UXI70227.1 beta-lactamase family protein [Tahibacter amnicola]
MKGTERVVRLAIIGLSAAVSACAAAPPKPVRVDDRARIAAMENGLRPMVLEPGQEPPRWTLAERMAHHKVPGLAIAILRNGEVAHVRGYGVRAAGGNDKVDGDTLFSCGSVSKVVTAATVLRLVDQGTLDLDKDVNTYLRRWHTPDAPEITRGKQPTLRMLMSHTSGLGQHGFKDYPPGAPLPTAVQTLDGLPPAKNPPVRFEYEPGTRAQYSGGGTTVTQLVLEDATQKTFGALAQSLVFEPLGMRRANFENPLSAERGNIAEAHDDNGAAAAAPVGWQSMPELAASGLWSSARDLGTFTASLIKSYRGESTFLSRSLAQEMMTEVARSTRGLGPFLESAGHTRIFHHGGANDSYKAWIEGHLVTGDGIVILTNGANGGALNREIRNAAADAFGWPVNAPVRTVAIDLSHARYQDYAGAYQLDKQYMSLQGIAPPDKPKTLTVTMGQAPAMSLGEEETSPLLALTPNRFVAPELSSATAARQLEFHRDAHGTVTGLTVEVGSMRAYYVKERTAAATKD